MPHPNASGAKRHERLVDVPGPKKTASRDAAGTRIIPCSLRAVNAPSSRWTTQCSRYRKDIRSAALGSAVTGTGSRRAIEVTHLQDRLGRARVMRPQPYAFEGPSPPSTPSYTTRLMVTLSRRCPSRRLR